jgi:hypothetical protein
VHPLAIRVPALAIRSHASTTALGGCLDGGAPARKQSGQPAVRDPANAGVVAAGAGVSTACKA